MNTSDVLIISKRIQPVSLNEINQIEESLGVRLPTGYREFITTFGEGIYCDLFCIFPPQKILNEYEGRRRTWREYAQLFFYQDREQPLEEAKLYDSIILGETIDGDQMVYYPLEPDRLYMLPRHSDVITMVSSDFSDLHIWDCHYPRLQVFVAWGHQTLLRRLSHNYTFVRDSCLKQFQEHWGKENVLLFYEMSDEWSWGLIFYLKPIGGRVQIIQDEDVTRTFTQNASQITISGGGKRFLECQISCDVDTSDEIEAFLDSLEEKLLVKWDKK